MSKTQQQEVDANYEAFSNMRPTISAVHANKFALMKNREIHCYFSSMEDAYSAANTFIADGIYSIQQVTHSNIELGFYNYAVPVH